MISFQIKNIKKCMAKLLTSDTFDSFLLQEATITTYNTFHIDGHLVSEYFQDINIREDEKSTMTNHSGFSNWSTMRTLCFDLIKGNKTPVNFKFVLQANHSTLSYLLNHADTTLTDEQVKAFLLNIKYESGTLQMITAVSYHTFLLDKTADAIWDQTMKEFLTKHQLDFDN